MKSNKLVTNRNKAKLKNTIGNTDISSLSNEGTVTGAIKEISNEYVATGSDDENLMNTADKINAIYSATYGEVRQELDKLGGFEPIIDETGKITGYKTKVGADTVFPFTNIKIMNLDINFNWQGSATEGVIVTKTVTLPIGSKIICFSSSSFVWEYTLDVTNGTRQGAYQYSISYDESTGKVTITMNFNPYTSNISVSKITTSGKLYYYIE